MSRLKYGKETIDAYFKQKGRVEGWRNCSEQNKVTNNKKLLKYGENLF